MFNHSLALKEAESGPKAVCTSCHRLYGGWDQAQRESCDCGGKLTMNFPYSVLIGYVKAGRHSGSKT